MNAGKVRQVTNFTIVGSTAKHCASKYMILFRYCSIGGDTAMVIFISRCRVGYTLGSATHF